MPQSSQNLYFHLGMNADDDGFCEHFTIMRMTDSKPDDLKILQAKSFINVFDDRVLVITDWKENNYLRADRYTASKYLEIYKSELRLLSDNQMYTTGIPNGDTGKDRLGKDRLGNNTETSSEGKKTTYNRLGEEILKAFEVVDPKNKTYYGNTTQRKACDFLLEEYGLEQVLKVINIIPQANRLPYMPVITTPVQLRDKWSALEAGLRKKKSEIISKGRGIQE